MSRGRSDCSFLARFGFLGSLDTSSMVFLGDSGISEDGVDVALLVFICNSNILSSLGWSRSWENSTTDLGVGSWSLKNLSGGVVDLTLLSLALLQWEQDQFRLVSAESLSVELQLFSAGVGSSVINGDTDSAGKSSGESSSLEFIKSKSTSVANLASISAGGG